MLFVTLSLKTENIYQKLVLNYWIKYDFVSLREDCEQMIVATLINC